MNCVLHTNETDAVQMIMLPGVRPILLQPGDRLLVEGTELPPFRFHDQKVGNVLLYREYFFA